MYKYLIMFTLLVCFAGCGQNEALKNIPTTTESQSTVVNDTVKNVSNTEGNVSHKEKSTHNDE